MHNISDRIAVMYLGKLCEVAPSSRLHESPMHPYTDGLLQAIPLSNPSRERSAVSELPGERDSGRKDRLAVLATTRTFGVH